MQTSAERYFSQSSYGIHYEKLKNNSLHHAVYDMRMYQIQLLLKLQPDLINFRTDLGLTPLMIACCLPVSSRKDKIIKLLNRAVKLYPYGTDHCKRSVVFYLINFSTLSLLKDFLQQTKFNFINETDIDGNTMLHYAITREDLGILEFIINLFKTYNIDINITNSLNYSSLLLCCRLKKYKSAAILIKMGATGFTLRDNEHFRNCLEWIEYQKNDQDDLNDADPFYFYYFHKNSQNYLQHLMNNDIQSVRARHMDCYSMIEKTSTSITNKNGRELYALTNAVDKSKQLYSQRDKYSINHRRSTYVEEIQNMSNNDVKEFLMDLLKTGNRKFNRPKRVSISLRDKIYLPRNSVDSTVTTLPLSINRQSSSAEIVHRLLNKLQVEYF